MALAFALEAVSAYSGSTPLASTLPRAGLRAHGAMLAVFAVGCITAGALGATYLARRPGRQVERALKPAWS